MKRERYIFDIPARVRCTETANAIANFLLDRAGNQYQGRKQMDDLMSLLFMAKVRAAGLGVNTEALLKMAENLWIEHDEFLVAAANQKREQEQVDLEAAAELLKKAGRHVGE